MMTAKISNQSIRHRNGITFNPVKSKGEGRGRVGEQLWGSHHYCIHSIVVYLAVKQCIAVAMS
jgi:hypothetical protein